VVVALAFQIENTPVVLLYERGSSAERDVSPIFVATTHERVERLPERVAMLPVAVAILELIVMS
jgi:predicted RNA-binding protein